MSNKKTVTVVQLDNRADVRAQNMIDLAKHVKENKTDFLLLPEMCFFDWLATKHDCDPAKWQEAINAHDAEIAKFNELGAPAVMGTRPTLEADGRHQNQAYIWTPENKDQNFHAKWNLPNEGGYWEANWYDRGDGIFNPARANGMILGVQICTEMWFFEHSREYGKHKVDLLCVPRATPHGSTEKWLAGGQAAAVVSGAFCLSSNSYTPEGYKAANIGGLSWIVSPEGDVLATTDPDNPFASVEIDLDDAKEAKSTYPRYVHD
ncbi:carbon-nitrogen hydrolase family protein [Pseudemcibacter aquimaris]|uniref:carbon-nitrogen hydrolase family protein n=1 Tax=Pseudemcibacter aquimaris TaxID=2857064 RepID=UPI002012AC60|nr:carbon-nitrogen hydrolase family protein [Pseudemcibacter aquimaris]MCC3860561.1 carbon-nitrogen hydrolase family protein [Pseudemcibacter aquimaris]WDU59384.1 carbon-nitrogen hydrolase family protein [Pseudemcibacter aquimaris]